MSDSEVLQISIGFDFHNSELSNPFQAQLLKEYSWIDISNTQATVHELITIPSFFRDRLFDF